MSEKLIDFIECDVDGVFVIEEFIGEGNRYRFMDVPFQGEAATPGIRFENARFYDAATARREWFLKTRRQLTQMEVLMGITG